MHIASARLRQTRLDPLGQVQAWVDCPANMVPQPGQYVLARSLEDHISPLAVQLFPVEYPSIGFWAAAPLPPSWLPGTQLELRGILGHGFSGFSGARRIALASIAQDSARLLSLLDPAHHQAASLTLFANPPLPSLPAWVEIYPLASLPESLAWPDYLALDIPLDHLPRLRATLGIPPGQLLPCPAQVLIWTPMPCSGLAECGACAVPTAHSWKLACSDGPVFDLHTIAY